MLIGILQQLGLTAFPTTRRWNLSTAYFYQIPVLTFGVEQAEPLEEPPLQGVTLLSTQCLQAVKVIGFCFSRFLRLSLSDFPTMQFGILKLPPADIRFIALALAFFFRRGGTGVFRHRLPL